MRQMADGHIANKRTSHFIVSHAAMQPAKKKEALHASGEGDDDPIRIHRSVAKTSNLAIKAKRQAAGAESDFEAAALRVAGAGIQ